MRIAITGGMGFIGQRLKALLEEQGHTVAIVDIAAPDPVDILDLPALTNAFAGCDAVYHLAAEHRDDVTPRERYAEVNVEGTRNVARAMDENGITRLVFMSSFAVYGLDVHAPDERTPPTPFNDYGRSKLGAETALHDWQAKNPDADLTIVRSVVVFGEGNRGNVHTLISQIESGRFVMVGQGINRKSMAYIGNLAAFLTYLLEGPHRGAVYNYADAPDLTMNELTDLICDGLARPRLRYALPLELGLLLGFTFDCLARLTGRKFPISAVRVQKFCAETTCDATKARRTGFRPTFSLEQGLARMIAHDFPQAARRGGTP